MKNKKIKLLSTCVALVGVAFGSLYSVTLNENNNKVNNRLDNDLTKEDINNDNFNADVRGVVDFNKVATGENLSGTVGYELNKIDKTFKLAYNENASGATGKDIKFNDYVEFGGVQYKLEAIGAAAFDSNKSISGTITFPNTIKVIGYAAFWNCSNITSELVFPESLTTISVSAFSGCSGLTGSLVFPEPLRYIGASAFSGCSGLNDSVSFQGEKIEEIGSSAFYKCENIKKIILPDSVRTIENNAFYCCKLLNEIKISKNLEEIGSDAFDGCESLVDIDLTSNIKILSHNLFNGCLNLTNVTLPNSIEEIENACFFRCTNLNTIKLPSKLKTIGNQAFAYDAKFGENGALFIPKSVESIDNNAFDKTAFITSCKDSVIYSSVDANSNKWVLGHNDISTISTLTLDNDTFGIANNAFNQCSFQKVILPNDSLTYINESAFYGCTNLAVIENLELCDNLKTIGTEAFRKSILSSKLVLSKNLEYIGEHAFSSCTNLEELVIPTNENRTTKCIIDDYAFSDCTKLGTSGELAIPNYVSDIGSGIFHNSKYYDNAIDGILYSKEGQNLNIWCFGCKDSSELKSTIIEFKNNTFGIAGSAFLDTNITEISNISSIKSICSYAFSDCSSLTKINNFKWSNDLYYIGSNAFNACSNLECDNLFDFSNTRIETIDESAFAKCEKINGNVILPNTISYLGYRAFSSCTNLKLLSINEDAPIQRIYSYAFADCSNLEKVALSNNIKIISDSAFGCCEKISSLKLPNNLEIIDDEAFASCTNLTNDIVLPKTLKYVGAEAFSEIKKVKFVFTSEIPCYLAASWIDPEDNQNIHAQVPKGCLDDYFVSDSYILIENYDTSLIGDNFKLIVKKSTLAIEPGTEQVFEGSDLFEIQVPDGASKEATYVIEMEDGTELPNWISIDESTGTITINKPTEVNKYKFKVTATSTVDPSAYQSQIITINVGNSWWLWLLIAILCLISAGVITFIVVFLQKKNKKKDDDKQNTETLNQQFQTQNNNNN